MEQFYSEETAQYDEFAVFHAENPTYEEFENFSCENEKVLEYADERVLATRTDGGKTDPSESNDLSGEGSGDPECLTGVETQASIAVSVAVKVIVAVVAIISVGVINGFIALHPVPLFTIGTFDVTPFSAECSLWLEEEPGYAYFAELRSEETGYLERRELYGGENLLLFGQLTPDQRYVFEFNCVHTETGQVFCLERQTLVTPSHTHEFGFDHVQFTSLTEGLMILKCRGCDACEEWKANVWFDTERMEIGTQTTAGAVPYECTAVCGEEPKTISGTLGYTEYVQVLLDIAGEGETVVVPRLVVEEGAVLTIPSGITLLFLENSDNYGRIENHGSLLGEITETDYYMQAELYNFGVLNEYNCFTDSVVDFYEQHEIGERNFYLTDSERVDEELLHFVCRMRGSVHIQCHIRIDSAELHGNITVYEGCSVVVEYFSMIGGTVVNYGEMILNGSAGFFGEVTNYGVLVLFSDEDARNFGDECVLNNMRSGKLIIGGSAAVYGSSYEQTATVINNYGTAEITSRFTGYDGTMGCVFNNYNTAESPVDATLFDVGVNGSEVPIWTVNQ